MLNGEQTKQETASEMDDGLEPQNTLDQSETKKKNKEQRQQRR